MGICCLVYELHLVSFRRLRKRVLKELHIDRYASLWHAPHKQKKLIGFDGERGSFEWEVERKYIPENGSIPVSQLRIGSYNYFDFRTGLAGTYCHFLVDVAPNFVYMIKHTEINSNSDDVCSILMNRAKILLFSVGIAFVIAVFFNPKQHK